MAALWQGILRNVTFTPVLNWPSSAIWKSADIVVFNFRFGIHKILSDSQYADLDAYLDSGKALIPIHVGVALQDEAPKRYAPYIGLSWQWANTGIINSTDRAGEMIYTRRSNHPLAVNLPDTMYLTEETYFNLLLLRGMAWASGEKFERFRSLVTLNANVKNDAVSLRQLPPQLTVGKKSMPRLSAEIIFRHEQKKYNVGGRFNP